MENIYSFIMNHCKKKLLWPKSQKKKELTFYLKNLKILELLANMLPSKDERALKKEIFFKSINFCTNFPSKHSDKFFKFNVVSKTFIARLTIRGINQRWEPVRTTKTTKIARIFGVDAVFRENSANKGDVVSSNLQLHCGGSMQYKALLKMFYIQTLVSDELDSVSHNNWVQVQQSIWLT